MDLFQSLRLPFVCFLLGVFGQDDPQPTIVSNMEIDTATEGKTINMRCLYKDAWARTTIQWVKLETRRPLLLSKGDVILPPALERGADKFEISNTAEGDIVTSQLTINNAHPKDEGKYRCVLRTDNIALRLWPKQDGILFLLSPPRITVEPEGDHVRKNGNKFFVDTGRDIILKCLGAGRPNPDVQWINEENGELVGRSKLTSELVLKNITSDKTGNYVCVAHNGIGKAVQRSVFIGVFSLPVCRSPTLADKECIKDDDEKIKIQYVVSGFPTPNITWFRRLKNGTKMILMPQNEDITDAVITQSKYDITESESNSFDWSNHGFQLQIQNFTTADVGEYIYEAVNDVGTCSKEFNLSVSELCTSDGQNDGQQGINWTSMPSSSPFCVLLTFITYHMFSVH